MEPPSAAAAELEQLRNRYTDAMIESAVHGGDTKGIEKLDLRIKALESRIRLHRPLEDPELQKLIDEVENEWRFSKEEVEVLDEAERSFMMRQMKSDSAHIDVVGRGISPVDEGHVAFDYEYDVKRMIKQHLTSGNTGPSALSSEKVDPGTGVRTRTTYDGPVETFSIGDVDPEDLPLLEESTVRTYSDADTGVQLRAEYQPPEHDLFMGSDVEMQVLHRAGDAPWEKVSMGKGKLPYEWMRPSHAEIQEELDLLDQIHGRARGQTEYHALEDEMLEVEELEEKMFHAPDVEMQTVRTPLLSDAQHDYLDRVDRMDAQDARTQKLREGTRRLEARRAALEQRELELFDEKGPSLGAIEDLPLEQRTALAMEVSLGESSALSTGEIMLKLGRGVAENAAAAAALVALGYVLPEKANKYINIVMDGAAVAALVSGVDPAFAAVQGTMELVKELNTQSQRLKYNVQSDRMHGRRFGYVRDGAHWYPAFVKQHEKWHGGLGERGNDIDLVYGEHMTFVTLPNNKVEPHFENPIGVRHVEASDGDMLRSFGDISKRDGLRDWYLLQPDEMDTVHRLGQDIPIPKAGFVVHDDDWSVYNVPPKSPDGEPYLPAWWASNLDLRRSLDYIKHWQVGSRTADLKGTQHDSGLDPSMGLDLAGAFQSRLDTDLKQAWPGDESYDIKEHWGSTKERRTNSFVLKTLLRRQIVALQKAQFVAAKEQGYAAEKFETVDPHTMRAMPGGPITAPLTAQAQDSWRRPTSQPWRNYVDFEKDLGPSTDSTALNKQLYKIMNYSDRTSKQKGYLGQKAIVRYLMHVIEDRGGADDLVKFLSTGHADEHDRLNRVGDNEYEPEGFFGSERLQKYVPPWANETEGVLPAYVLHSLNPKNQNLTGHLRKVQREAQAKDPSSWAHSTGSGTKPEAWSVSIHGADTVESTLQKSQEPKPTKKKKVRFDETQKFPYRTSKSKLEKRNVTLHDLVLEFKANGVRNLSKDQIRQVRLFEAKKAASQAQKFHNADPHDRRSQWFLDQGKRYEFDPTLNPPRWVSSLRDDQGRNVQLLQEEKRRKAAEKSRVAEQVVTKAERMKDAQAQVRRQKALQQLAKDTKKESVRVAKAIAKGAPAEEQETQVAKHPHVSKEDRAHLDDLLKQPEKQGPAQTVPVVHKAREVAKPPEHMMHLHPDERMERSETSYADTHPDYVPVSRLSWDEHAIARMEGRPITSHAGAEKPPHEADPPQTAVKVI